MVVGNRMKLVPVGTAYRLREQEQAKKEGGKQQRQAESLSVARERKRMHMRDRVGSAGRLGGSGHGSLPVRNHVRVSLPREAQTETRCYRYRCYRKMRGLRYSTHELSPEL